ncbi:MAG: glycosyltransferase family 39 protein, partial [Thermodesulfovibrionia bacterium]|nr:glycosyltransferase family 39 protein [Thermodesulfovibrionia bacterium]
MSKSSLPALIFVIIAYSAATILTNQYTRLTADSMLYFSLAHKYLNGDLSNAINGYWCPLLAWLLIPFLYFGKSDVFAINAINLIIGILTIFGVWKLSYRFEMSEKIRSVLVVALLPITVSYSLVQPMDFLLLCILVYYLYIIFSARYSSIVFNGISCGVLGALAYFTKAYAFPFFIVHFLIINIFHYFNSKDTPERKGILKNAVAGFLLFILISGSWIMVISDKYGEYTFSTMRRTNFNAPGPDVVGTGLEFGVPVFHKGFYPPPNETAFVIWEDPSYLKGDKWSAWDSPRHFKHFIKLVIKN